MKSFISILAALLSVLSISSFGWALPSGPSSGHLNVARNPASALGPFEVAYGDSPSEEPQDSFKEINGGSRDINKGFGGKYVWLVKVRTTDNRRYISDFRFRHTSRCGADLAALASIEDYRSGDLAKGAGGECRFLYWEYAQGAETPLQDAALWRAPGATTIPPPGWSFISADLNGGRGGDYLYIVTK